MVALGRTFSPNLSKFSEVDLFDKPFRNFLPLFCGGLQNMSAEDDENFYKSELI